MTPVSDLSSRTTSVTGILSREMPSTSTDKHSPQEQYRWFDDGCTMNSSTFHPLLSHRVRSNIKLVRDGSNCMIKGGAITGGGGGANHKKRRPCRTARCDIERGWDIQGHMVVTVKIRTHPVFRVPALGHPFCSLLLSH